LHIGRNLTLTNAADDFTQGLAANNVEITLNTLGGDDIVRLNRTDDLSSGNTVTTGLGADIVLNLKEFGNLTSLGGGNEVYIGRGFGSFASNPGDGLFAGAGNNQFFVETFKSSCFGKAGNDLFVSVKQRNAFLGGGRGEGYHQLCAHDDSATLRGSGVAVILGQVFAETGAISRETLVSIENASGSGANDLLIGSGGANRLEGGGGGGRSDW
jgi:serralysin